MSFFVFLIYRKIIVLFSNIFCNLLSRIRKFEICRYDRRLYIQMVRLYIVYLRNDVESNKMMHIQSLSLVCFLVPVHQSTLYVGSPVQNLSAYLGIWQYAVVSVVLEAPAADFQFHRQFLVRIIAFPVQ